MAQLNASRRYCTKQLLFWSGYLCYAILLEFVSFKEWNNKKKSLCKQNPQFPYVSQLRWYFHIWAQFIHSSSKILALAQRLLVAFGWSEGPNGAWCLGRSCLVEERGFNSLNENNAYEQKTAVEFTSISNVLIRHMSSFNNSLLFWAWEFP